MRVQWVYGLIGIVAVGIVLAPGGVAAAAKGKAPSIDARVENLKKRLSLSEQQAQQIRGILESSRPSEGADRPAIREHRKQTNQQILAVLNEEQKTKYTRWQRGRLNKMKTRQQKGRATGPGAGQKEQGE